MKENKPTTTTTRKRKTAAASVTHVHATVEKVQYGQLGRRTSQAVEQYWNPGDWRQFQETGPGLGWFLIKLHSAPEGVDTEYTNPGGLKGEWTPEKQAAFEDAKAAKK